MISAATADSSLSRASSRSAISRPRGTIAYSFFRPPSLPTGTIQPFSRRAFSAPYSVPAPRDSRPPVFSSMNCMTA